MGHQKFPSKILLKIRLIQEHYYYLIFLRIVTVNGELQLKAKCWWAVYVTIELSL